MDPKALTIKPHKFMFKKLLNFQAVFMLLGSMLLALTGHGQGITTSSISGVVTDDKGGALPGATVLAVHTPSGTRYGITTNAQGRFNLPAVRIGGPYQITVSFIGFQNQSREVASAELNTPVAANFKLIEEGKQLTEVVITSQRGSIVDSERNGVSTNIGRQSFERLPTLSRSFTDFSTLTPQAGPGFSFGGRSALYNNFSIDGSTANNVFGLSALPGGQSNATPVSIDAIEQLNVSISPFDVTQGSFTGAGVNAVTRSGTNRWEGSAYYFGRNQNLVGTRVGGIDVPAAQQQNFSFYNRGARVGGPLIRNKLFFFANVEQEQRSTPAVLFPVGGSDAAGRPFQQTQQAQDLQTLTTFLTTPNNGKSWTFNPGTLDPFNSLNQSLKFLAKIDWNISDQHKLTVRYNQLNSFSDVGPSNAGSNGVNPPGPRGNSVTTIPFSGLWYRINNNLQSVIGELNSTFSNRFANNLQVGYTSFRDFRQGAQGGPSPDFPTVDIANANGTTLTSFGAEPFTPNNVLNQDVIQLNDRFDIFAGKHTISVGTANEFYKFQNGFTPAVRGIYTFNSVSDFIANVTNPTASTATSPTGFTRLYSAVPGVDVPVAEFNAAQLGFYAQDAFNATPRLRLTVGIRADIPTFNDGALPRNTVAERANFANAEPLNVAKLPDTRILWSPRVGFNWDVKGDRSLQVRGGTGIFTGRVPFVWISNQISNNGVLFGTVARAGQAANVRFPFSLDPVAQDLPASLTGVAGEPLAQNFSINVTTPTFRFPQVWRTSFGIDKTLPGGWVATFDAIYTKDINAVYIRDANLAPEAGTLAGDGRPVFGAVAGTGDNPPFDRRLNDRVVQALVLDNTNRGYALSLTGQIQKRFSRGFEGSLAYTYTDSKDINAQSASTANTIFTGQPIVGSPNSPNLAFSNNLVPHRIVGYVQYRREYLKNFASTISLTYTGQNVGNFSYVYAGNPNSDGINGNDLIYIPRNQSEIVLQTSNAQDTRSTQQIWDQLNTYIDQDSYLSKRRGQYAERNGAYLPWQNLLNFRFLQDFYIAQNNGRRHTLQISADFINVLNLIDSNWGVAQSTNRSQVLNFVGYETPNTGTAVTTGRPIYQFAEQAPGQALNTTFTNNFGLSSRYQIQLGARYIF